MTPRNKKKLIAGLLFVSCLISGWLLAIAPSGETQSLQNFGQADSLLQRTLADYNVSNGQVSTSSTQIDSNFTRIVHTVYVPPGFSKTQFHASLQQRLAPYGVALPAKVIFPDKDMHIQFDYYDSIIRTVKLITDEDLQMQRSFGSIIVAFEDEPADYLLETLHSFGEPIAAAVTLTAPLEEPEWWTNLSEQYATVFVWPKTNDGRNLAVDDSREIISTLKPLEQDMPGATLLCFADNGQNCASLQNKLSLQLLNVRSALIMNDEMNQSEFDQAFRTFIDQARRGERPTAIIMGTEQTLKWTQDNLNTFKKSGFQLINPAN